MENAWKAALFTKQHSSLKTNKWHTSVLVPQRLKQDIYNNHTLSFRYQQKSASTELSKLLWQQKEKKNYKIEWNIVQQAAHIIVAQNCATFAWLKNS